MYTQALADVVAERERQQSQKGFQNSGDDNYTGGELASAALNYVGASLRDEDDNKLPVFTSRSFSPLHWPWALSWWKPKGRRLSLVKAGALILAEIERIDRLADKVPEAPTHD